MGVLANQDGRIGELLLNRPNALNALDPSMIRAISDQLAIWRDMPQIHAVLVGSTSDRSFCAGGDVRAVREHALAGNTAAIEQFFAAEYALNQQIAEYPKPVVALIDSICLGGGIGLSVHAAFRVVTERAVLAMPETAIALFPDVGTTYVLPRLPGAIGMWLALTGARLTGADAVHAGLATHYVSHARMPALRAALAIDGVAALGTHAEPLPTPTATLHRRQIDRCFDASTVAQILVRLTAASSAAQSGNQAAAYWAATALSAMRAASPSSVLWSFAMLQAGRDRTLPQALAAELDLTRRVTLHHDFLEGVRAMLVDKDRQPHWSPSRIEDVDPGLIAAILPR